MMIKDRREHTLSGFDFWRLDISEMACDVADVVVLGSVVKYLGPERTRLLKVNCTAN